MYSQKCRPRYIKTEHIYLLTGSKRFVQFQFFCRWQSQHVHSHSLTGTNSRRDSTVPMCLLDMMRLAKAAKPIGLSANSHRLLTVIWYSITHSLFLSRLKNLPSLQILPTTALPFFYLNIYYVDSPDCLLLFLAYLFSTFSFFSVFTLFSCRFRAVD